MAESRFVYVTFIRTTPEKLWEALTSPEFTRKYRVETAQECDRQPGSTWRLKVPDGRVVDGGEVIEIEPGRRLVLSWQNQFIPKMHEDVHSRMTYEIDPQGDSVKPTVIHESELPDSKLIEGVSNGWPKFLSSLKSLLETGESLELTREWPKGM